MTTSQLNQYVQYITDHVDDLTTNQYLDFIETVLDRIPLHVISHITIKNSGEKYELGIKQPGGKCPFCDNQDKS